MDNNSAIVNFESKAMNVCNLYKTMYSEISEKLVEAQKIQENVMRNVAKYKVGQNFSNFDIDNLDGATVYQSLSDREKMSMANQRKFDLFDSSGNFKAFDDLDGDVKDYFNNQVAEIKTNRDMMEADVQSKLDEIDTLNKQVKNTHARHWNEYNRAFRDFKNTKSDLEGLINKSRTQSADCVMNISDYSVNTNLSDEERNSLIETEEKKQKVFDLKTSVFDLIYKVYVLYEKTFERALYTLENTRISNDQERKEAIENQQVMQAQISIIERVNNLVESLTILKKDYEKEYTAIGKIESELMSLEKNHSNTKTFVFELKDILNEAKNRINKVENENLYDISVEKGIDQPISPQPVPQPAQGQTQGSVGTPSPDQSQGQTQGSAGTPSPDQSQGQTQGGVGTPSPDQSQGNGNPDMPQIYDNGLTANEVEVAEEAKRVKSSKRMTTLKATIAGGVLGLTAFGLGFLPPLAPISAALFTTATVAGGAVLGNAVVHGVFNELGNFAKYQATSFKLGKIARDVTKQFNKDNKKSGIRFEAITDRKTHSIRFAIMQKDKEPIYIDSNTTGLVINDDYSLDENEHKNIVQLFQEKLDKSFKKFNKKRGIFQKKNNISPVTVDNLPVLYTQFGGYNINNESNQIGIIDPVNNTIQKNVLLQSIVGKLKSDRSDAVEVTNDELSDELSSDQSNDLGQGGAATTTSSESQDLGQGGAATTTSSESQNLGEGGAESPSSNQSQGETSSTVGAAGDQSGQTTDNINDDRRAYLDRTFVQPFGLDTEEGNRLVDKLMNFNQDQIDYLISCISGDLLDKEVLYQAIEGLENPSVDKGRNR